MADLLPESSERLSSSQRLLILGLLLTWLAGFFLSGCAARRIAPETATFLGRAPTGLKGGGFWWACRFRVAWPVEREPDWAVDLFLAHAVVQPVLRQYESSIGYWRFHRRAARDDAGHRFSFLFYTDPGTAAAIIQGIEQSTTVRDALTAGIVEMMVADDPSKPSKPGIEDTSDHHWSPTLQRIWPVYIMGVSSLWLGLIDEAMGETPANGDEVFDLLERYRQADARINTIWYKEGQHALLHHLNAIFGYKPMLIRKEMAF